MELKLTKPIAFFDIEATGPDVVNDRIIEISILRIEPNGKQESFTRRVNPPIPISPEAYKIHGIKNEDLANEPKFSEIAQSVANFIKGCDLSGYNSTKFDIPILAEELLRADIDFDMRKTKYVDVQVIFFKMEQRTLGAAYKYYCNKNLDHAHNAEADAIATYEVLKAQLDHYPDLKNDIGSLSEFTTQNRNVDFAGRFIYNEDGVECFNFGKHKGESVEEVLKKEPGFYKWMINGDFPLYTKKVLTAIKLRSSFGNTTVTT